MIYFKKGDGDERHSHRWLVSKQHTDKALFSNVFLEKRLHPFFFTLLIFVDQILSVGDQSQLSSFRIITFSPI